MSSESIRQRLAWTLLCVVLGAGPGARAGAEPRGVADAWETPTLAEARRLADRAREAVSEAAPETPLALADAARASNALGLETRDAIELALHVARSRLLARTSEAIADRSPGEAPAPGPDASAFEAPGEDAADGLRDDLLAIEAAAERRGVPGAMAFARLYLAELEAARGRPERALAQADRALLVPEDESVWPAHVAALVFASETYPRTARPERALDALRRARDVLARHRTRLDATGFLARAEPIHRRLADRLLQEAARAQGDEQASMREALEALEDLKVARLQEYFGEACLTNLVPTTPDRLPDATLLHPVVLDDRVVLLVGREGRLEAIEAPIDPETLHATSRALRRALQDPTTPRFRRPAAALYDALIRPLPPGTLRADSTLVVVAAGPLREIPPAALYDARAERFLVETMPVAVLPTLRILPPQPIDRRRVRMLVAGFGEASDGFEALPAVTREIAAVSDAFPATRQEGEAFTIDAFEQALEERAYDLLHIASHGRFDADAAESFLVTADGRLGLAELARIIARTRHRTSRPIELLALSACETALGDEASVLGLAGVAVQSGARSAVATLWRVNDEATARLFDVFYDELARPDRSRARALQTAQRALLADPRFRHPVFWSPFLLVNSWR